MSMAVVDMPLEQLVKYAGKNPCPGDFDQYWQTGLDEIKSIDPDVELKKVDFPADFADCYDMYFTSTDNARIYSKLIVPKDAKGKCPCALSFHGYTGDSGDWFLGLPFAANGIIYAAMDCRGQGGRSEDVGGIRGNTQHGHIIRGVDDEPNKLLYRHIFLDTAMLARVVGSLEQADGQRLGAMGASQGGALSLACAALVPEVKYAYSRVPFLSDYLRVWELDFETGAYVEIWDYFRKFDPFHERENEFFTRLGYIDVHNHAKNIKAEVFMDMALRDDICPPSTQFAAYNNITSKKQHRLYYDFGHGTGAGAEDAKFRFISKLKTL